MLRRQTPTMLVYAALAACAATSYATQAQQRDEVIALEKQALDRWGTGDAEGFLSIYADEITYFDSIPGHRIDGLAAMRATRTARNGRRPTGT